MLSFRTARRLVSRRYFSSSIIVDNPYSGEVYCEVPLISAEAADEVVTRASERKETWKAKDLTRRIEVCEQFLDGLKAKTDEIARDISGMMGKPEAHARREIKVGIQRAKAMISLAPSALAEENVKPKQEGLLRKLVREPVGVVLVLTPWNYPVLTALNTVIPAVLSGNSVILKPSMRAPLCANHIASLFDQTSAPERLVSALHCSEETTKHLFGRPEIGHVHFTGSLQNGRSIYSALASKRFIDCGLELGGKDSAFVAADANLDEAVSSLVDGALFNAGQSRSGIERVYVHEDVYEEFLSMATTMMKLYKIGNPQDPQTQIGPMAQEQSIPLLTAQVEDAVNKGARLLLGGSATTDSEGKGRFFQPTLLADCTHDMSVMLEENFGPIMAVQSVKESGQAIRRINSSAYGLSASLWTSDIAEAELIAPQLEVGTVFMNRCDYLDPYLAWGGVKDTGKGTVLSRHSFDSFTRLKSYHFQQLDAEVD